MPTVLVIDDNRHTADSLCQLVSLLDLETRVAYGPRAAMMVLAEFVPDALFLDLNMPGVSGFEVLGYLRRDPRLQHVPVIVVTADDERTTAQRARQEGAVAVVVKPATLEALEEALRAARLI